MLIKIPFNVQVFTNKTNKLVAISPKGLLCFNISDTFTKSVSNEIRFSKITTHNNLIANYIRGLSRGYQSMINLSGIGYKVFIEGKNLILTLGYSYKVYFLIPDAISCQVKKNIVLKSTSFDYNKLNEFVYSIQKLKLPNPYSGKGIQIKGVPIVIKKRKAKT